MALPDFEDLPFYERPDLTPYIIHLTKNTRRKDSFSAFDNLVHILKTGEIWGSDNSGFIKGPNTAACFMDVPFAALKYVLNPRDSNPQHPRYEPYGVVTTKKYAYRHGCRPVLYLSDNETRQLKIQNSEKWRVVRFEVNDDGWMSWLHEREWRCRGDFALPVRPQCVLVRDQAEAERLQRKIQRNPKAFRARPRSIIPLTLICQGLPKV